MPTVDQIKVANWTPAEALAHLRLTFEEACMRNPDLMERYIVMRVEVGDDPVQETAIMREGLRTTIAERYPFTLQTPPPLKVVKGTVL